MKVTRAQADENHDAIVKAASQQMRKRGFDQINVAEVAGAAGLTHGALYSRYGSKDALKAVATARAFEDTVRDFGGLPVDKLLKAYLSPQHRDNAEIGCPNAALVSDVWRQPAATREAFCDGLRKFVALVGGSLELAQLEHGDDLAVTVLATMVGGMALSRAVRDVDQAYSDEILHGIAGQLSKFFSKGDPKAQTESDQK